MTIIDAYEPSRLPPQFVAYLRKHGRRKILFGSNWPMIAARDRLAQLELRQLDDEARGLHLQQDAERVFGLG